MHINSDEDEEVVLNLAPMIDVVFLLLIFFMVATTFIEREKEMAVDLPQAESGEDPSESPEMVIINILEDGTVKVDTQTLDENALRSFLERVARKNPDTPVEIRGDQAMEHRHLVTAMDACLQNGLHNLGIGVTNPPR